MAAASGKWFLNGLDVYDTYGLLVITGNAQFLTFPERKDSLQYDWAEENGVDIDLSAPRFKVKEIKMRCAFVADTETAFWTNRDAFFAAMAVAPGWKTWRINDHNKDYSVFYRKVSDINLLTRRIKGTNKVVCTFLLELTASEEIVDAGNPPVGDPVSVYDHNGNLITTVPAGGSYTVAASDISYNGVFQKTLFPGENLNVVSPYSMAFNVTL